MQTIETCKHGVNVIHQCDLCNPPGAIPNPKYVQSVGRGLRITEVPADEKAKFVNGTWLGSNMYGHIAELYYGRKRVINAWAYMDGQLSEHITRYQGSVPATYNAVTEYNLRITVKALDEQIAMFDRFIRDEKENLK